jgi:hypothetical protein
MSHIIGGSAFGIGDALIDPKGAVLLENVSVVLVGTAGGGGAGRALAMELEGRVNKSQFRSSVLYLMNEDGAAAIISELLGLAHRVSPEFFDELMARVEALPRGPQ